MSQPSSIWRRGTTKEPASGNKERWWLARHMWRAWLRFFVKKKKRFREYTVWIINLIDFELSWLVLHKRPHGSLLNLYCNNSDLDFHRSLLQLGDVIFRINNQVLVTITTESLLYQINPFCDKTGGIVRHVEGHTNLFNIVESVFLSSRTAHRNGSITVKLFSKRSIILQQILWIHGSRGSRDNFIQSLQVYEQNNALNSSLLTISIWIKLTMERISIKIPITRKSFRSFCRIGIS